jgi:hypothetical protein
LLKVQSPFSTVLITLTPFSITSLRSGGCFIGLSLFSFLAFSTLSVAPGSHAAWTWGLPVTLSGKKGTRILFDCDLVHGGVESPAGVDRMAKQYKIIHKDDLPLLNHLSGTSVCKRGTTVSSFTQWWMRITSYLFVVPIQWIFLPLLDRQHVGGLFGFLQRLVPINHYNNYRGDYSKDL